MSFASVLVIRIGRTAEHKNLLGDQLITCSFG